MLEINTINIDNSQMSSLEQVRSISFVGDDGAAVVGGGELLKRKKKKTKKSKP